MALGRKFLESMGLTEVQVQAIIDAHTETVNGLIARAETAEKAAESTQAVTKERDDLKKQNEELQKNTGDAAKIQKELDDFKASVKAEKSLVNRRAVMRDLLKNTVGIKREKALDLIVSAEKLDSYEWDENDKLKDPESVAKALKEQHADWISETETEGLPNSNPPSGGGSKTDVETLGNMSMSDYIAARKKM